MTQELFKKLAGISEISFSDSKKNKSLPKIKISAELASIVDELLDYAKLTLDKSPEETLDNILKLGLESWGSKFSPEQQTKIDVETDGKTNNVKKQPVTKPEIEPDDPNDPDPATAQRKADAYVKNNTMFGYTPMTLHSLSDNSGNAAKTTRQNVQPQKKSRNRRRKSSGRNRRPSHQ